MEDVGDELASLRQFCRTAPRRLLALLILALALCSRAAIADPPGRKHFDVPASDAAISLNEFSKQSALQVLFDFNLVKGKKTRRVEGDLEIAEALKIMLAGSGLVFDFVNDHTLAVTLEGTFLHRLLKKHAPRPRPEIKSDGLDQVLVAGSMVTTTQPLIGGQLIELTRVDIEHSGFATAQDLLRTLPEVFGGGPSEDTLLNGREAGTNSGRGDGLNLRGLDAGATLILIDGVRMAPSGTAGAFQDISNIPLSAVDHIDILPDSTAARYGADAVGGVVNFVMIGNFAGAQTQARTGRVTQGSLGENQFSQLFGTNWDTGEATFSFEYYKRDPLKAHDRWQQTSNLTPYGGSNFDQPYGSPGSITDGLHFWPLPKGQNGTNLSASSLVPGAPNVYDTQQGTYVAPDQTRWNAFGKFDDRIGDNLTLFGQGLFSSRKIVTIVGAANPLLLQVPSSNPFYVNPTGIPGPVTVLEGATAYFGPPSGENRINTGNFAVGANLGLPLGWSARGYIGYTFETQHEDLFGLFNSDDLAAALADSNSATAFNPFGDGAHTNPATLAKISRVGRYDLQSRIRLADVSATGPVVSLPGGDATISLGTEYRRQTFSSHSDDGNPSPFFDPNIRLARRISAAYVELHVPVIGPENATALAKRFEFSVGGRYEDYSDIGGQTIPKLGVLWSPFTPLNVRATWTKAIRPPNLPDTDIKNSFNFLVILPDPHSSTGLTTTLIRNGNNPELQAERANNWTVGLDYIPSATSGATFALTYFNVRTAGRIDEALVQPQVLEQPELAWLVTRNITASQLAAACASGTFVSSGNCTTSGAQVIVDARLRNIALLKTDGLDLTGKYTLLSTVGKMTFGLNGTYIFGYSQANSPGSVLGSVLNTQNNPINLRARGSIAFEHGGFGIVTGINYDNSYRDVLSQPNRNVSSWTTIDERLTYETRETGLDWLNRVRVSLDLHNILNRDPPFLNNPRGVGYDQENGDLLGRFISLDIRKRW